jgi:cytochrome c5
MSPDSGLTDRDFWKFFSGLVGTLVAVTVLLFFVANSIGAKPKKPEPGMEAKAIAERIKPVGEVTVASGEAALNAVVAPAVAAGGGETTYNSACVACHGAGIAGAPKVGDKAAWAPRIAKGIDALYTTALKGKGAMPPKGGNTALKDADVKAAVDLMVSKSK